MSAFRVWAGLFYLNGHEFNLVKPDPLLRAYAENDSQTAFAEIVRRHVDLVYGVAFRRCDHNHGVAEEITQEVFCDLARKAERLSRDVVLSGWLFRHTCFTASKWRRRERRRLEREKRSLESMTPAETHSADPSWHEMEPLLDEALQAQSAKDRDALLLRFVEGHTYREVGDRMMVSEEAARKRVERALEKTRRWLANRGVTTSASIVAANLTTKMARGAPAGVIEKILMGTAVSEVGISVFSSMLAWLAQVPVVLALGCFAGFATMITFAKLEPDSSWETEAHSERVTVVAAQSGDLPNEAANPPTLQEVLAAEGFAQWDLLTEFLPYADVSDLDALATAWGTYDWKPLPSSKWKLLLRRWAELDPPGAFDIACERDRPFFHGSPVLRDYVWLSWAELDYESATTLIDDNPEAAQAMIAEVVRKDLPRAERLLEKYPGMRKLAEAVLAKVAESDPKRALAWAARLPVRSRGDVLRSVATAAAESDVDGTMAFADTLANPVDRDAVIGAVISTQMEADPEVTLARILDLQPGQGRRDVLYRWARHQAGMDPQILMERAARFTEPQERRAVMSQAIRAQVEKGDRDLLELLDANGWDLTRANPMDRIGNSGVTGGNLAEEAREAILKLSISEPEVALQYAAQLPSGRERQELVRRIQQRSE